MLCPNCHRENDPTANFCIYCGSSLAAEKPESPPEQPPSIEEEIRRLRQMVGQIVDRLDELEQRQQETTPPLEPEPAPEEVTLPPVETAAEFISEVTQVPVQVTPPVPSEEVPVEAVPPHEEKPVREKEREWEQILGGSWLARIGVLALIIGIGFFLKFAFDNDWLGPAGRVILGVIAGLIMLGTGFYWRRKYPILTQVLSGGGIAVLYLSIFASFAIYDLIHMNVAVVLLLFVSIVSAVLALRYDSMSLALIGIFGAFVAPYILGAFGDRGPAADEAGQAVQLLAYVIVVDIGVLILSTFRNWRWFTLLALGCSLIAYGVWYSEFERNISIATAETGITLIFIVFAGATTLFHIIWRRAPQAFDFILMLINASAYFGISLGLMWDIYREWMGGFIFLMALFYGGIAYMAYKRQAANTILGQFALGTALVFITIAIPVQLGDKAWTTITWAAEATILLWLAFRAKIPAFRYYSYIVYSAAVVRLLAFDTTLDVAVFQPIFNERFLAFIVTIAAVCLSTYLLWKNRDEEHDGNALVFMGAANFLTLWIIAVEVYSYSHEIMTTSESLSLIILLVLAGILVLHRLAWRREPHTLDIFLTVVNAVAFVIISIFIWEDLRSWMGGLYFLLAAFYGILTYHTVKRDTENIRLIPLSLGITVAFFTAAIAIQLEDTVWTTICWAAEFAIMVWLSFTLRLPQLRNYSYVVFLAMAVRLLGFDTHVSIATFQPVINERFLAYVVGIVATYLAVYTLWRNRETFTEWNIPASTLLVSASFLTLWILSFEVWQYFSNALLDAEFTAREGLESAQHLSLTAVWAIYAVIALVIGIARRWRSVRIGALGLLVIPIVKVFVYDVFKLDIGYRIGAFVGLGLLLLISAYLYQRYSQVIKGVFTEK